ncbi:hypothetical protein BDV95DRAFT_605364 [Massariosphaeria phaeospora]|uniref:Uncharacterized protein n=1 Tax=Massariosphaeria phaeospora TaxID=100035 RepID=A0A7C8I9B0_9PLEO|nr:hypothetical protein BDV95DRAFT_605364 [Massariosphaeria phaeospora]
MTSLHLPAQAGGNGLTRTEDWPDYMVDAAVTLAKEMTLPITFDSEDEGKLLTFRILNYLEAHNDYYWPDFTAHGFDFGQCLRLHRQLVNDVYAALRKNRHIQVQTAEPGTPKSDDRGRFAENVILKGIKRCRRTSDASDADDRGLREENAYLASIARDLIQRANLTSYGNKEHFIDRLHDGLVEVWDQPQAPYATVPGNLRKKEEAWTASTRFSNRAGAPVDETQPLTNPARRGKERSMSPELGTPPTSMGRTVKKGKPTAWNFEVVQGPDAEHDDDLEE